MSSTREQVLQIMVNRQRCTINDLAAEVELNPISVRHHISKLQANGLVAFEEERHGVGRPRRVYFLTEKGVEQFPARTVRLTTQLLDQLKENLPKETVRKLFRDLGSSLTEDYRAKLDLSSLNLDERLNLVQEWLTKEGFNVQIERDEEHIYIHETSCPYYHVGQVHSEVCSIDKMLISEVLNASPQRITCLLDGDKHCTYVVPMDSI